MMKVRVIFSRTAFGYTMSASAAALVRSTLKVCRQSPFFPNSESKPTVSVQVLGTPPGTVNDCMQMSVCASVRSAYTSCSWLSWRTPSFTERYGAGGCTASGSGSFMPAV